MKKICFLYAVIAFVAPLIAGAVTWQMDSAPFGFPGTAVKYFRQSDASRAALNCNPSMCNGYVTFQYALPQGAKNARLTIYNLVGKVVESFDLSAEANTVRWGVEKNNVVTGVYLAAMRYGSFENKIQISIVK